MRTILAALLLALTPVAASATDFTGAPSIEEIEARQAAERKQEEAEEAADRERLKQAAAAEAARSAALEEFRQRLEREKAMREAAVRQRLDEACTRLYRRAPDGAVLNELCYRQFLATGLPEG